MGYRLNIRGSSVWENLLKDNNIEISDTNGYFTSGTLDGVLDELYNNSGGIPWSIVSANTTLSVESGYFVNTSSGQVSLDLPVSATIGDRIILIDYAGTFASSNCVIGRNGHNIMGLAEDFICDINNLGIEFIYADATKGWKISDTAAGGGGGGIGEVLTELSATTQTPIYSFSTLSWGSAKLSIQVYNTVSGERQISEMLVVHDSTTAMATEYGLIHTGINPLATFDVDISTGNVRLLATGASANTTEYKVLPTTMTP